MSMRFDPTELLRVVRRREEAQTMAEYSVVLGVISIALVAALTALSGGITAGIDKVVGLLP